MILPFLVALTLTQTVPPPATQLPSSYHAEVKVTLADGESTSFKYNPRPSLTLAECEDMLANDLAFKLGTDKLRRQVANVGGHMDEPTCEPTHQEGPSADNPDTEKE